MYLKPLRILFLILIANSSVYCSILESFCAGVVYRDSRGRVRYSTPRSVGYTNFNKDPHGRVFAANIGNVYPSAEDRITMDIRKVEEPSRGTNSDLNGWLQLNIKGKNDSKLSVLAVWALTDTRETIGEFVSSTTAQCISSKTLTYTDENLIPCATAPVNEQRNLNMFIWFDQKNVEIDEVNLLWRTSVSYCNFPKKFRFMVAASTAFFYYYRNVKRPRIFLTNTQYGSQIYTSKWIHPKFYGPASAPLFGQNNLNCNTSIQESKPQWIKSISATTPPTEGLLVKVEKEWTATSWIKTKDEYEHRKNWGNINKRKGCKPYLVDQSKKLPFQPSYARCITKVVGKSKEMSLTALQNCDKNDNFDDSDSKTLKGTYDDYLKKRENMLKGIKEHCDCPPIPSAEEVMQAAANRSTGGSRSLNPDDLDDASDDNSYEDDDDEPILGKGGVGRALGGGPARYINPPARKYVVDQLSICDPIGISNNSFTTDEQGLCANSKPGRIAHGVRRWHAVSILLCVVVLIPVTSYMPRYLKSTFAFSGKTPIPLNNWYIVHIAIMLPMMCMYTTGMAAIFRQRPILGYSYSNFAQFHRICGYFLFSIGFFEIISGIVRPRNMVLRKVVIALHCFGGVLLKYLGLIVCILSYRIPASPTAFVSHLKRKKFEMVWSHIASIILISWGIVDVFYQIFITLHVLQFDRKYSIKRPLFPIIIPLMVDKLHLHVHDEFEKEESFQKRAFTIYGMLAFVSYVLTCISIYIFNTTFNEQSYGPMFCSHNKLGMFLKPGVKQKSYWYC